MMNKADRVTVSLGWNLDGHACISALTAGHLALGLYADFEAWLVGKVGDHGEKLLSDVEEEIGNYADGMFKCFLTKGNDRNIETPSNSDEQVTREIEEANDENQLCGAEFASFGLEAWLNDRPYGLLIGDAESRLFTTDFKEIRRLCQRAVTVVVDTAVYKEEAERSLALWDSVKTLTEVNPQTFVSISDVDAKDLALFLGYNDFSSIGDVASRLQSSLPDGHIVLHTSMMNAVFDPRGVTTMVTVPTCNVKPLEGTNGAGDTFNGAFALAAMVLGKGNPEKGKDAGSIQHILAFATAVVSLRLESGRYPTRSELFSRMRSFAPKLADPDFLGHAFSAKFTLRNNKMGRRLYIGSAWPYGWDDLPKIFLVDLDHTLCDSKKWRVQSTIRATMEMGLFWEPEEIEGTYNQLYENHTSFEPILKANLRYCWKIEELFYFFKYLDQFPPYKRRSIIASLADSDKNGKGDLVREVTGDWLVNLKGSPEVDSAVGKAMLVMERSAAFPYSDAVASLYRIRDILKFELRLVTEGDASAQRWKIERLGLGRLFPDEYQFVERAFLSQEQHEAAFSKAYTQAKSGTTDLKEAQAICIDMQKSLKRSFRGMALRDCVEELIHKRKGTKGVFVCTIGDRIDTDVVPYVELKEKVREYKRKANPGLIVGRLVRGPYGKGVDSELYAEPDISVEYFDELVQRLAKPGFWRDKQPIHADEISAALPKKPKLSRMKRDTLCNAMYNYPEVREIIRKMLEQVDVEI
jgi:hypothetical protein